MHGAIAAERDRRARSSVLLSVWLGLFNLHDFLLLRSRSATRYRPYHPAERQAVGAGCSSPWAAPKGIGQRICCSAALAQRRFAGLGAGPCSQYWQDSAGINTSHHILFPALLTLQPRRLDCRPKSLKIISCYGPFVIFISLHYILLFISRFGYVYIILFFSFNNSYYWENDLITFN